MKEKDLDYASVLENFLKNYGLDSPEVVEDYFLRVPALLVVEEGIIKVNPDFLEKLSHRNNVLEHEGVHYALLKKYGMMKYILLKTKRLDLRKYNYLIEKAKKEGISFLIKSGELEELLRVSLYFPINLEEVLANALAFFSADENLREVTEKYYKNKIWELLDLFDKSRDTGDLRRALDYFCYLVGLKISRNLENYDLENAINIVKKKILDEDFVNRIIKDLLNH